MESTIVVMVVFAGALFLGLPIAFGLIVASIVGLMMLRGFPVSLSALSTMPYANVSDIGLAVIPLFILMGFLASKAGVSAKAYDVAYRLVGRLPGGLAISTVFACAAFAATSGSSVATSAAVGRIALSEMRRFRYADAISVGTVASAGLLGIMIPPSIMLVVYGIITQEDIGSLLLAGILPGILTAFIFCLGLFVIALWKPHLMPVSHERFSWREKLSSIRHAWGIVLLFTIIIGGIYTGIFTVTEAAGVGAVTALILAFCKRDVPFAEILGGGRQAVSATAMIFLILIGAGLFSQYIALSGLATDFARMLTATDLNRYVILLLILLAYIPLGMFLEPISMCLITLPIVYPAVTALGFDPIWFGIIVVKMSELANITPPIGVNVFVIRGIAPDVPLGKVFQGASIFLVFEIITLAILIAFPAIATFLPELARQS
ncbi:TRAP transporter large permease [Oceanibacterium hippocampi]|uniref:TRAP transporter large permease protein n=1 Tax=Oceanibacterium hippocampi TaxID=745714 RepID=A0A1Y5TTH8_9PROT|nr:TRAP transporter large permease [Oceanibacterium hippocampi]SLN71713.1 Sialic acid TRAP transporter permease protein SiaT [Oceanibacterium hippocampi]